MPHASRDVARRRVVVNDELDVLVIFDSARMAAREFRAASNGRLVFFRPIAPGPSERSCLCRSRQTRNTAANCRAARLRQAQYSRTPLAPRPFACEFTVQKLQERPLSEPTCFDSTNSAWRVRSIFFRVRATGASVRAGETPSNQGALDIDIDQILVVNREREIGLVL